VGVGCQASWQAGRLALLGASSLDGVASSLPLFALLRALARCIATVRCNQ